MNQEARHRQQVRVVLEKPLESGIPRLEELLLPAGQVRKDVYEYVAQRDTCKDVRPDTLRFVKKAEPGEEEKYQSDKSCADERRAVGDDLLRHGQLRHMTTVQ
jgi:hypothetical protein